MLCVKGLRVLGSCAFVRAEPATGMGLPPGSN